MIFNKSYLDITKHIHTTQRDHDLNRYAWIATAIDILKCCFYREFI